jgi:hypothetical protein
MRVEQREENCVGRRKSSSQDKSEGAMDKLKGRAKEAAGGVTDAMRGRNPRAVWTRQAAPLRRRRVS